MISARKNIKSISSKGFSLIELIIVIVIIGILIIIAYPGYQSHIHKSRRMDGISTLLAMQAAQENFRYNHVVYGNLAQIWDGISQSPDNYYQLSISNITATSYTLTAKAQNAQANDSDCPQLVLTLNNGTTTKSPASCWNY